MQAVYAAGLSSIENKIIESINASQLDQITLLEKLVNLNSGTSNIAGIHQVGDILRQQFDELGFKTYWVEEPAEMHRAGTLVAERTGHQGKRLLLIGHLDTVFSSTSPFQQFKRDGDVATGPGVIDDKGGDVVILYALKALHSVHALDDAQITVILTGDEEDSGKPTAISRKPLIDAAAHSDIALDFEWAFTSDSATIARRGISHWTLKTQGNEAHSSLIFQNSAGFGAIYEIARIVNTMREQLAGEHYLSFNPGLIMGGTDINEDQMKAKGSVFGKENVIAKMAIAKGDLRFITAEQKINAEKKIKAIVDHSLPGTSATIILQEGIPAMPPSKANLDLLKKYSEVSTHLGTGSVNPLDPGLRGAGDISYVASMVSASLAGLGPVGTAAHSVKETLDIKSLPMQTKRAALLIYSLMLNTK